MTPRFRVVVTVVITRRPPEVDEISSSQYALEDEDSVGHRAAWTLWVSDYVIVTLGRTSEVSCDRSADGTEFCLVRARGNDVTISLSAKASNPLGYLAEPSDVLTSALCR
jgi:hypothetical protein